SFCFSPSLLLFVQAAAGFSADVLPPSSVAFGSMNIQPMAPTRAAAAATRNEPDQPRPSARMGVRAATVAPPSWQHMFMTPETEPAEDRPMSALIVQKALCEM